MSVFVMTEKHNIKGVFMNIHIFSLINKKIWKFSKKYGTDNILSFSNVVLEFYCEKFQHKFRKF